MDFSRVAGKNSHVSQKARDMGHPAKQLHSETGFVGSFWQKRYYERDVRDERELVENSASW
jgi:hypothetical protein